MRFGETQKWEKAMQVFMDREYARLGYNVDRSTACREYDVILRKGNLVHRIEEKFLFTESHYDQMLVELIQNVADERLNPGWFFHVKADLLFWIYCPSDHVSPPYDYWAISFPLLKQRLIERLGSRKSRVEKAFFYSQTPNHITLNVPLSYRELGEAARYVFLRERPLMESPDHA